MEDYATGSLDSEAAENVLVSWFGSARAEDERSSGRREVSSQLDPAESRLRVRNGLAPLNEASSDSVATELLPWLKSMYAISASPRDVVIGGYTAGGTKASLIALKYPTLFGTNPLVSRRRKADPCG